MTPIIVQPVAEHSVPCDWCGDHAATLFCMFCGCGSKLVCCPHCLRVIADAVESDSPDLLWPDCSCSAVAPSPMPPELQLQLLDFGREQPNGFDSGEPSR